MSKSAEIRNALEVAKKNGFNPPPALEAEIANLENPQYRIAVVGKFQVGKSMLINKVFLQDKFLWEGDGLCTTSVTTEVQYGPARRIEVYHWKDAAKTEETLAENRNNPTADDFKTATVGKDRVVLANETSQVKLFDPNESLKGYVILDTPGLDDPDKEILLNTTYRVIPSCDLAIIVAEPRQLNELELDLLHNKLIGDGITKFMVMLSYKPEHMMTATARKEVIEAVQAQLADLGKKDVPVEMYCFDEAQEDILCSRNKIFLKIRNFLRDNALAGREDRVAHHLGRFLGNCQLELAAKITAAGQSDTEKQQLSEETRTKLAEIEKKNARLMRDVKRIFDRNQPTDFRIRNKISPVFTKFVDELEASDLGGVQKKIKDADKTLKLGIANALADYASEISKNIRDEIGNLEVDFDNVAADWNEFLQNKLRLKDSKLVTILVKTPKIIIEIVNIIGLDFLLPFGFIFAAIVRGLQSLIPILKNLTLGNLAKSIIVSNVKTALDDAENNVVQNALQQIGCSLESACENIGNELDARYQEQAKIVTDGLAGTGKTDTTAFEAAREEIAKALASLQ